MKKLNDVPYQPMNAQEHYLHAMTVRLDALCHMVSNLVEYIAEKEGIATTNVEVKKKAPAKRAPRKKKEE